MSKRKAGWYWVKWENGASGSVWLPSCWAKDAERWHVAGFGRDEDDGCEEIGPRIPTPDEMDGWQTVPVKWPESMTKAMVERVGPSDALMVWTLWPDALAAAPTPGGGDE